MDKENVETKEPVGKVDSGCLSISQQTDHFIRFFSKRKNDIEGNLVKAERLKNSENLPSFLNHISEDFLRLQRYVADATLYLPLYNIRVAQDCLKQLQEKVYLTQNTVFPKKKFTFKKKQIQSSPKHVLDASRRNQRKKLEIEVNNCGFNNLEHQVLETSPDEVQGKDVSLHCLKHCTVQIRGCANTVLLSQLVECHIFLGPVSTSVFVEDCQQCVFVVACQQLRIHCTQDCDVYLHVTSKAIIEDCTKLRFAPYNWDYDNIEDHFKSSGLDLLRNGWNDVDDFNWLSKSAPSPNWSVIPAEERAPTFK